MSGDAEEKIDDDNVLDGEGDAETVHAHCKKIENIISCFHSWSSSPHVFSATIM